MVYLLAVQASAYPIEPDLFAIESAFAIHLRLLLCLLQPRFDRLVLVAPAMSAEAYKQSKAHLTEISANDDRIQLVSFPEANGSIASFWKNSPSIWRRLRGAVRAADFIHTGLSSDIYRPMLAMLNLAAWLDRKPSAFFIDIDFRQNSRRYYELGIWSRKSYLFNRVLHDNFRLGQVKWAVRSCDLVLLKSTSMVSDLGRGLPHVRFFLSAAHGDGDVISDAQLNERLRRFEDAERNLEIIYFGRLVPYKGCDYMLEAIAKARREGARVAMTFVGDGECLPGLKEQASRLGIADAVRFLPPVPYGPRLFELVDRADLAIAAPKVEDTPRATLDAMARGVPTLAFDIDYNKTLAELSGAVILATWPNPESVAEQLEQLDRERARLAEMSRKAVAFARANSQDIWLHRRITWTLDALERRGQPAV